MVVVYMPPLILNRSNIFFFLILKFLFQVVGFVVSDITSALEINIQQV